MAREILRSGLATGEKVWHNRRCPAGNGRLSGKENMWRCTQGAEGAVLENKRPFWSCLSENPRFFKVLEVSSRRKIFVVLSIGSLLFPRCVLRADAAKNIRSGIEVVITGLTRNQFGSNPTRVRIPPAAPKSSVCKRVCAACRLNFFGGGWEFVDQFSPPNAKRRRPPPSPFSLKIFENKL